MVRYQVKNWDKYFENNKSRQYDHCSWCPIPNKQNGLGYGKLMRLEDGVAIYGAFVSVVLMLSTQPRARQGHLTDTGGADGCPYSAEDISIKTRVPAKLIQRMFDVISHKSIGWIESFEEKTATCGEGALDVPLECPQGGSRKEKKRKEKKDIQRFRAFDFLISLGAEKKLIRDWFKVRKTKKLSNTETAMNGFKSQVDASGLDINAALKMCGENSWGGFKAEWIEGKAGKTENDPELDKIREELRKKGLHPDQIKSGANV